MATVAFHADTSRMMVGQAAVELADGNSLQASEKGWGAAAHAVKAIAEGRGWRHKEMADLFRVAHKLADEMERPEIRTLFMAISILHTNIYEEWLEDEGIADSLADVGLLLDMLGEVAR